MILPWSRRSALNRDAAVLAALLSMGTPKILPGQSIQGRLVAKESGAPIEGAQIVLMTADDRRIGWTLTNALGRFGFALASPGRFVLRADRIGHASTVSDVIEVGRSDTLVYRMEVPLDPVRLDGLKVEGASRDCKIRPEEGLATARVWQEVRKALEAAAETSRRQVYQFLIRRHERELDERARRVIKEMNRYERRFQDRPFESLEASRLIEEGFVQPEEGAAMYYAPDADVLLSDLFLDSHCFRLSEGEDEFEGLLGLAFEPIRGRDLPEISGTLWLEPETAKLQRLEFRYQNLGFRTGSAPVGGTLTFAGLPNGTWFVQSWSIRMPILGRRTASSSPFVRESRISTGPRVVGIREEGALVTSVHDQSGAIVVESGAATVEGVVIRKGSDRPVAGAVVSIMTTGQEATTAEDGTFRLTSLGQGVYELLVSHPDFSALGYGGDVVEAKATTGEVTSTRLTIPSRREILERMCVGPGPDQGGIVAGWVRHAVTDAPIPDAGVRLTTVRYQRVGAGIMARQSGVEAFTRDDGFFIYCGTPEDTLIDVEVEAEGMKPWNGTVRMLRTGYVAHVQVRMEPEPPGK